MGEVKLLTDDMILQRVHKNMLKLINEFSKVTGLKSIDKSPFYF